MIVNELLNEISSLFNVTLTLFTQKPDLLLKRIYLVKCSISVHLHFIYFFVTFLALSGPFEADFIFKKFHGGMDLLLLLLKSLSEMLVVHFLCYELIESVQHREVSFFVETLDHKVLQLADLTLHLVHKLINISISVLDFLVIISLRIRNLNLQHLKIVLISFAIQLLLDNLKFR